MTTDYPAEEPTLPETEGAEFERRLDRYENVIVSHLHRLYGDRADFQHQLERIVATAAEYHAMRPDRLRQRDASCEHDERWFQRPDRVGAWLYVDRYAETLGGLGSHLDELCATGINHLHLMPVFARPEPDNDGGYAVTDYRRIHPPLGTIDDFAQLAAAMHARDMTVALDFVFNHTADDHPWALAAKGGSIEDRDVYLTFATEEETLPYAEHLRSIFPDEKPGAFIFDEDLERWVWATFHTYQWDLDYRNPETFRRMLGELLFLANLGVDVLRLDAVPFIWKHAGTSSENLPEAHVIIRALNALVRVAAPAMIFKSEAIVHPRDVRSYLGSATPLGREAELAYNALLMVELWEALATGRTTLLRHSMNAWFDAPSTTAWVNYVRSHDDIGWGFADEDAGAVGIDPVAHRRYLMEFYLGQTAGSFASGAPFQANPVTGDVRLSGTTASLAGLERAIAEGDSEALSAAIARIRLIHGVMLAAPGVPLLNVIDLIGMVNDDSYRDDPTLVADSRWLHRPIYDWDAHSRRHDETTVPGKVYAALSELVQIRRRIPAFAGGSSMDVWDVGNDRLHVASIDAGSVIVIGNFSDQEQRYWLPPGSWVDALGELGLELSGQVTVPPYGLLWLLADLPG